jgi:hypothetical protein
LYAQRILQTTLSLCYTVNDCCYALPMQLLSLLRARVKIHSLLASWITQLPRPTHVHVRKQKDS